MVRAKRQLSLRSGHSRFGRSGVLDLFFDHYVEVNRKGPMAFLDWVDKVYDPEELTRAFSWCSSAGRHCRVDGAPHSFASSNSDLFEGGDPLDLDERVLADESADHDAGRGRPGRTLQQLAADLSGFLVVVEGENELGCLDDVGEVAADALEDACKLVKDLACLQDNIPRTHDVAFVVRCCGTREEHQVANANGRRECDMLWPRIMRVNRFVDCHHRPQLGSRNRKRWILPVSVFGRAAMNSISRGDW